MNDLHRHPAGAPPSGLELGALALTVVVAVLGVLLVASGTPGTGGLLLAMAVVGVVAIAMGPTARPAASAADVLVPRPVGADRTALRVAQRRLLASLADPVTFDATVRVRLAALARQRLARHHGVDVGTDPERARALLGDALWSLVDPAGTAPPVRPRRPRELADLLTRLEAL